MFSSTDSKWTALQIIGALITIASAAMISLAAAGIIIGVGVFALGVIGEANR